MSTALEQPQTRDLATHTRKDSSEPAPRLFTVAEYYRIGEMGIFDEDGQVELFEGRIYKLSPKNPFHSATVHAAASGLQRVLGDKAIVRGQAPVHFDDYSEPEPDVSVLKPRADEYSKAHPTPEDCLLLVEVSLSTLTYDREMKGSAYAAAGIPQYLILNLSRRELEDYREPSPDGYRYKRVLRADESFNFVAFPEIKITVGELLPPE